MQRTITALVVAGVASLGVAGPADAAPIRECGNYVQGHWTYRPIRGAGTWNLTTRNVTCRWARLLVKSGMIQNWPCRRTVLGPEYLDVRCTNPGRKVIHYQVGA